MVGKGVEKRRVEAHREGGQCSPWAVAPEEVSKLISRFLFIISTSCGLITPNILHTLQLLCNSSTCRFSPTYVLRFDTRTSPLFCRVM